MRLALPSVGITVVLDAVLDDFFAQSFGATSEVFVQVGTVETKH